VTRPAVRQRADVAAVRIGRPPDPLQFVPAAYQTWEGRYDDPDHTWRTLYLARDAYGAWVEVLARFKPHDDLAAALKDITEEEGDPVPIPTGRVPLSWLSNRRVARARITGRFADVGEPDTLRWLATRLPDVLARNGVRDLDLSAATGPRRALTQAIARELYLHAGTHAIEYPSRHGETVRCIAVFETGGDLPAVEPDGTPYAPSVEGDDRALERAMGLHGLSWES
jgi:hypothetical protein